MLFVVLLGLSAFGLATVAEFFSVYGLASTFKATFWGVVVMGAALGGAKLMAISYLYRYWDKTSAWLKTYLFSGIAALMLLTSSGIFGYLSTGYQQDVLPYKQKQEQLVVLEEEKVRLTARKKQIDDLLATGPTVDVAGAKGGIDPNAARTLRETARYRQTLSVQYKAEQESVTARLAELDKTMLTIKQELIVTESHIGPIMYIAKAMDLPSDEATKYLIYLIMFAFEPMAIALTLALNVVIRERELAPKPVAEQVVEPVAEQVVEPVVEPVAEQVVEPVAEQVVEPVAEQVVEPVAEQVVEPVSQMTPTYPRFWNRAALEDDGNMSNKIAELLRHHKYLTAKEARGEPLSEDERWERNAITELLTRHGMGMYVTPTL